MEHQKIKLTRHKRQLKHKFSYGSIPLVLTKAEAQRRVKFYPSKFVQATCSIYDTCPCSVQVSHIYDLTLRHKVKCFVDVHSGNVLVAWLQNSIYHIGILHLLFGQYKGPYVVYLSKCVSDKDLHLMINKPVWAFPCFSKRAKTALEKMLI